MILLHTFLHPKQYYAILSKETLVYFSLELSLTRLRGREVTEVVESIENFDYIVH